MRSFSPVNVFMLLSRSSLLKNLLIIKTNKGMIWQFTISEDVSWIKSVKLCLTVLLVTLIMYVLWVFSQDSLFSTYKFCYQWGSCERGPRCIWSSHLSYRVHSTRKPVCHRFHSFYWVPSEVNQFLLLKSFGMNWLGFEPVTLRIRGGH